MIPYNEIKKLIRYKVKDNNEVAFSDYDIKMAVNEVIRYLSLSQALNNSDFLNKGYSFNEGHDGVCYHLEGVELPEDFVTLVGVRDYKGNLLEPCDSTEIPRLNQYKISGNRLYCGVSAFNLMYKAALDEIHDDEDGIDLPPVFKDTIVKLAVMIMNQQDGDIMSMAAEDAIEKIIPKRRYRNAKIKMPFRIG